MKRVPGIAWLMCVAAIVVFMVAAAVPRASAPVQALQTIGQGTGFQPGAIPLNPRALSGTGALIVGGLLFLLFVYRRRLYILCWILGWVLVALSMFVAGRSYAGENVRLLAYGLSQFLGLLSALVFVVSADAYPTRPRLPRGYVYVLLPLFLWFALAPLGLGLASVYAPGHILIAGALGAAGVAHLGLLRQVRMLGAAVVGASMLVQAVSNVWVVLREPVTQSPDPPNGWLTLVLYLIAALGMQLMTFEDMTWELRRTNRRLETAQGKLRRMVITDALTGCRNRRFFDEIIGREVQRHRRYGIPLSVLFVDIDRFKAINDTLGHEAGDRVLQQVASFLLHNIREADYVFRWGGDEFLILLSCGEAEAARRGAALQAAFARSPEAAELPAGVGLSVGTAEIEDVTADVMALIRLADERMYENKRALRKRGSA
ncbi:MAG TPA: GGDEF domain-containing protein [Vicinamibacterales bacterium]|nr:GGDEF domain-containing protein [Vicinamibacterales bacterium]